MLWTDCLSPLRSRQPLSAHSKTRAETQSRIALSCDLPCPPPPVQARSSRMPAEGPWARQGPRRSSVFASHDPAMRGLSPINEAAIESPCHDDRRNMASFGIHQPQPVGVLPCFSWPDAPPWRGGREWLRARVCRSSAAWYKDFGGADFSPFAQGGHSWPLTMRLRRS